MSKRVKREVECRSVIEYYLESRAIYRTGMIGEQSRHKLQRTCTGRGASLRYSVCDKTQMPIHLRQTVYHSSGQRACVTFPSFSLPTSLFRDQQGLTNTREARQWILITNVYTYIRDIALLHESGRRENRRSLRSRRYILNIVILKDVRSKNDIINIADRLVTINFNTCDRLQTTLDVR